MKAFPNTNYFDDGYGMDLRDYFAAKVLPALVTASVTEPGKIAGASNIAESAYKIADAMMEARK